MHTTMESLYILVFYNTIFSICKGGVRLIGLVWGAGSGNMIGMDKGKERKGIGAICGGEHGRHTQLIIATTCSYGLKLRL